MVGSSRNRIRGRVSRLDARSSRRRIPPEYVRAGRSAASASSKRSSQLGGPPPRVDAGEVEQAANICGFSRPLRISSAAANCPVSPSSWRTAAASCSTSSPKTSPAPSGASRGREHPNESVVFPAPFGQAVRRQPPPPPRGRHPQALSSRRSAWPHPRRGRRGRTRGPQPCSGDLTPARVEAGQRRTGCPMPRIAARPSTKTSAMPPAPTATPTATITTSSANCSPIEIRTAQRGKCRAPRTAARRRPPRHRRSPGRRRRAC